MRPGRCVHMAGCLLLRHRRVVTEESAVTRPQFGNSDRFLKRPVDFLANRKAIL